MATSPENGKRTRFTSDSGREAVRKRWEKVRADAVTPTAKPTGGKSGSDTGEGASEGASLGLLARDVLAAIASDTSAPHASRVQAARALREQASMQGEGHTLTREQERRLVAWAEGRIPIELGSNTHEQASLFG